MCFSAIMSTVMSQQPPKDDEEDEDEEQGEEFVFEDTDEEKLQEDCKGIGSESTKPVQLSKKENSETSDNISQGVTDDTQQLSRPLPPAGQEEIPTKDVTSTAGTFRILTHWLFTAGDY